jgi:hypothetical protein
MQYRAIVTARSGIAAIRATIADGHVPQSGRNWAGANVVISEADRGDRYREIVTPHALGLSWVFKRLRDAFCGCLDSCSKFEFYGRLELAANRCIRRNIDVPAEALCDAVIDEAEAILREYEVGDFQYLDVALDVRIFADEQGARY